MANDDQDVTSLAALVLETRAIREAVHELVARMQQDRRAWVHETETLGRRARLTAAQRLQLRSRAGSREPRR
jgi:hypothetical protein